ncbi:MAG: 3-dehydroquinate synthase [Pirellulales bacterium]
MPDATEIVRVELAERSYVIRIGTETLCEAGRIIAEIGKVTHALLIVDANVANTHGEVVARSLSAGGTRVDVFEVPAGETSKSVAQLSRLWDAAIEAGGDRQSLVVAVGGGVVGDLAGFVAASFTRGVRFLQVPTTLLAQVDSSVGGKVGINLAGGKNLVGAFWQPVGVLIDTATLDTLPEREYRSGLAEVVKYGVILDADFFAYLEANVAGLLARDNAVMRHIIARSCQLKAQVVENDERETTGLRAVLNYGHTFCHAIETAGGYGALLHGEAVSIGMICASRLAERLGRVDAALTERQRSLLDRLGLPTELPEIPAEELLALMSRDKKVEHGRLRFVLPTRLGHVELVGDVPPDDVRAVLTD